ncbi:MAG: glycosyltransferase family A protein [Gemmatimonadaceae bacterium]|nr:glycosyltransferase family A protein [Gemmatimonadaceae bacterium]
MTAPFSGCSADPGVDLQAPFDVAVIIPTVLRPTLADALQSVFAQRFPGRIQVLVGIDAPLGDASLLARACEGRPSNVVVQALYPGYSTSVRHGGLHPARDGGVLRVLLSYLANSRRITFLDDDNWWHPDHLAGMVAALDGHDWAWALRWFVHPHTRRPVCIDEWESIGPGRGCFAKTHGGWVDPNGVMFDKLACEPVLRWWAIPVPGDAKAMSADRQVFHLLNTNYRGRGTDSATVFYQVDESDDMHRFRQSWMGERYVHAGIPEPAGGGASSASAAGTGPA